MREYVNDTVMIVAAAGASRRFGQNNKLFVLLDQVPVFIHCLRTAAKVLVPGRLILVVPPNEDGPFRSAAEKYLPDVPLTFVYGGETRTDSVYHALTETKKIPLIRYAAIHDAARPFLTEDMFRECLTAARTHKGGALLCRRITDTVKQVDRSGLYQGTVDRDSLRAAETPQIFPFKPLFGAYERAIASGGTFTDDAQIMELFTEDKPFLLEHKNDNRKITYPEDLP